MMTGWLDDFLIRAGLAGVGAAFAAGPVGCFVVWRRMAYFGDATAHAAILGVALSLATGLPVLIAVLVLALTMAALVTLAAGHTYAMDTMLGVAAHGALALGLVAVSFMPGVRIDLAGYLFGDILAVSRTDLAVIWGGGALVVALLAWRWDALLLATLSPDLAAAEQRRPELERLVLVLALATLVAVALKVVGALLITALLIVPPAAARALSATPEAMAVGAGLIGGASALGGLALAWHADTPTGPSIVVVAIAAFLAASFLSALWHRRSPTG
jgi:zinc transport system permease protein